MRPVLVVLVTTLLALAGCLGNDAGDAPVEPSETNNSVQIGDRPEPTFGEVNLGEAAAPDTNATLLAEPQLQVGEWWKIRMYSPLDGREAEYIRVMAYRDVDVYVFGMPHEGWYKEAVVYHVPFFGDVNFDLSGHAHDVPFQMLKFPLTDDQTWTTSFEGGPELTATVKTDQAAQTAEVTFKTANGNTAIYLVYDAKVHEVVKFEQATIHYEVIEHGYGFEGWVTVPRGEDLVFFHGRIGGGLAVSTENPGVHPNPAPSDTVTLAGGFNRMSFILMRGDIGLSSVLPAAPPVFPGVYGIKATAPDGTVYELPAGPMTGGLQVEFYEATEPIDGDWAIEYVAAGGGAAFIEGIAYHQYDIKVPTGEKRADHSHPVIR